MTFISYAQNFEDVTLWRALKNVEHGFYIDVGAWDPDLDSVTRAFSDRSWRGVNVEPLPEKQARLRERRPHDVNLAVAVSDEAGETAFFEVAGTGLSTVDEGVAAQYGREGYTVTRHSVRCMTLAEICRQHAPDVIHFLKLDCEGHEAAALAGCDFGAFRPWIILGEAVAPGTLTPVHQAWEHLLLAADYRFAWFDGLNRFYVAEEQFARLAPLVARSPSCFDGFIRAIDLDAAAARQVPPPPPPSHPPAFRSLPERIELAAQGHDCDDLPKVAEAGHLAEQDGVRVQVMHNGLRVPADGYCGAWMTELVLRCRGHHEPQEERQFHAVLQTLSGDATMIELGSNWAFYSAWFLQGHAGRRAVLLEPDPANRAVGEQTMALNGLHATVLAGFAGEAPAAAAPFATERSGVHLLPCFSVPQLMAAHAIERLDVLHCDIQGAELRVLTGCADMLRAGRIGWAFVSTHAPFISNDPLLHQRCLDLLRSCGGLVVAEHDPWESFSGDGLIVARFGPLPAGWQGVPCSVARRRDALFRDPCYDLADAMAANDANSAMMDGVIRGVFQTLLYRDVDPVGQRLGTQALRDGLDFGAWLKAVLGSPEFALRQHRFGRDYLPDAVATATGSLPALPASSPVTYAAAQLRLERPTALGDAGDLLTIPNDRMILPAVLATGDWLPAQLDWLAAHVDRSVTHALVDVGANVGLFSRQALRAFPNIAAAHCVEPDPDNYRALCANLSAITGPAIHTYGFALGPEAGTAALFRDLENCGNNSLHPDAMRDRPFAQAQTAVVAVGDWLGQVLEGDMPIIWKSDTQGNDEAITAAIPMPVWRRVRVAVVELWRIRKSSATLPGFLDRVADMPNRRLGDRDVSVEEVARFLESEDWAFDDLYMWR